MIKLHEILLKSLKSHWKSFFLIANNLIQLILVDKFIIFFFFF